MVMMEPHILSLVYTHISIFPKNVVYISMASYRCGYFVKMISCSCMKGIDG